MSESSLRRGYSRDASAPGSNAGATGRIARCNCETRFAADERRAAADAVEWRGWEFRELRFRGRAIQRAERAEVDTRRAARMTRIAWTRIIGSAVAKGRAAIRGIGSRRCRRRSARPPL